MDRIVAIPKEMFKSCPVNGTLSGNWVFAHVKVRMVGWGHPKFSEVKVSQSCLTLPPHGLYSPWNSPGQNTGVDSLSLLQGIFPTQESNPGLPYRSKIPYQLSHEGRLRILEWVAYPFSSRSSRPRNWTRVSCIAGGFFSSWATRGSPKFTGYYP